MVSIGLLLTVGVFILIVLIFAFFVFPDFVCTSVGENNNNSIIKNENRASYKDPLESMCYAMNGN